MADRTSAAAQRGSGQPAAPDGLIGRTISERYTIRSLIARGGMGKVYLADQAPLGRACALKVLNPNYQGDADPEFERRFFLEASVASKLHHPNTVTIFDYGKSDDGILFIAMEYLEGSTLHRAIRETGGIGEERTCHIARQMCRALREAHALGVIHRDLKPANVFLVTHGDEADFVKLLDFGLVKNLADKPDDQLTKTGLFMGSPKYMAPEQIQGDPVDARTDIYSLGVMLYEMLCGHVPFERTTSLNILMAHVNEEPPPMVSQKPDLVVSAAVDDLVMRCLSKDPNDRFSSMDDLLRELKMLSGSSGTGDFQSLGGIRTGSGASWRPPAVGTLPPPNFTPRLTASGSSPPVQVPSFPASLPPPSFTPSGSVPVPQAPSVYGSYPPTAPVGFAPPMAQSSGSMPPMPAATPYGTVPPPPVVATTGHRLLAQAEALPDPSEIEFRPRRKPWLLVAALFAIGIGGFTGFLMMRAKNPLPQVSAIEKSADGPRDPAIASPPPASAPTAAPSATTAAPDFAKLRIATEPPGATVREKGAEVCLATPCELTYHGKDAADGQVHELTITKLGYSSEIRSAKIGAGDVQLTLTKKSSRGGRGGASPKAENGGGVAPTPSGFKDVPY